MSTHTFRHLCLTDLARMAALLLYVPVNQIMFGTDYPYVSIESNARELLARHLPAKDLKAIKRDNALRLMPSLSA